MKTNTRVRRAGRCSEVLIHFNLMRDVLPENTSSVKNGALRSRRLSQLRELWMRLPVQYKGALWSNMPRNKFVCSVSASAGSWKNCYLWDCRLFRVGKIKVRKKTGYFREHKNTRCLWCANRHPVPFSISSVNCCPTALKISIRDSLHHQMSNFYNGRKPTLEERGCSVLLKNGCQIAEILHFHIQNNCKILQS